MAREIDIPPFYVGQEVVSLYNFTNVRKVWGFNYPHKNDKVIVESITYRERDKQWFITVVGCDCPALWCKNFAPIDYKFQSISLSKILEKETPLISVN